VIHPPLPPRFSVLIGDALASLCEPVTAFASFPPGLLPETSIPPAPRPATTRAHRLVPTVTAPLTDYTVAAADLPAPPNAENDSLQLTADLPVGLRRSTVDRVRNKPPSFQVLVAQATPEPTEPSSQATFEPTEPSLQTAAEVNTAPPASARTAAPPLASFSPVSDETAFDPNRIRNHGRSVAMSHALLTRAHALLARRSGSDPKNHAETMAADPIGWGTAETTEVAGLRFRRWNGVGTAMLTPDLPGVGTC
jgi:hypothetical protein